MKYFVWLSSLPRDWFRLALVVRSIPPQNSPGGKNQLCTWSENTLVSLNIAKAV